MSDHVQIQPGIIADLPLDLLDFDPEQPRKDFDPDYIEELADSIRSRVAKGLPGLIQPITVRPNPEQPGRYFVVYGECRTRGSRQAEVDTIRVQLDERQDDDDLERYLDQVRENYQRRDLNPMELAEVLERLHSRFGLKSNKAIEETLAAHGIKKMSREYVANMRRLTGLPEWAQDMIRKGINGFTASHGKYLLQAIPSEPVTETVRNQLESREGEINTNDLRNLIYRAYQANHPLLGSYNTRFDHGAECNGCQKRRKVSGTDFYSGGTYCLDKPCYDRHNRAAMEAEKQRMELARAEREQRDPGEIDVDADNRVDIEAQQLSFHDDFRVLETAEFDVSGCEGCKHNHVAAHEEDTWYTNKPSCFDLACYHEKEREHRHARVHRQKLRYCVTEYIRRRLVGEFVAVDPTLQLNLLGWLALQRPNGRDPNPFDEEDANTGRDVMFETDWYGEEEEEALAETYQRTGLVDLQTILTRGAMGHAPELAALAVRAMNEEDLITVGRHVGLSVDNYRIDDAYCGWHTPEQLTDLLRLAPAAERTNVNSDLLLIDDDEVIQDAGRHCLKLANAIGVPDDIRELWDALFTVSQETEEKEAA